VGAALSKVSGICGTPIAVSKIKVVKESRYPLPLMEQKLKEYFSDYKKTT
jgi:hypothetical protein